ncbi:DMT family transporter [Leucothrix arctica]|uniref:EamA family transporter n=1 Tax=Leucothrix arctica TaxID=1481894 RepID=A0A317CDZ4_9GAMM|nr:DMT family transporter [Leucothrix arctica]PWQ96331.1 EamA family transporter [Leucothrix arctica]
MQTRHVLALIFLAAIWGASFLFARISSPEFGPLPFAFLRVGIAALALAPILFMANHWQLLRQNIVIISIIALLNSGIPFILYGYTALYLNAGITSVLNATTPILTAVIAHYYLKSRLTRKQLIGLFIGIIGVTILMSEKISWSGTNILPLLAPIAACLCYAISANMTKKKLSHIPPKLIAASSMLTAGMILMPFALMNLPDKLPSLLAWNSMFAVALISTALAYLIFFHLIREIGPAKTVSVTLIIPIFGILWGVLFLDETITFTVVAGTLVILIGAYLSLSLNWFTGLRL